MHMRGAGRAAAGILLAAMLAGCETADLTPPEQKIVTSNDQIVSRGPRPLTAAEIRIYLANSTLSHVDGDRTWHVYLLQDGEMIGQSTTKDGAIERNRGTWSVRSEGESGLICRQWEQDWGGGRSGCAKVYQYGNEFEFAPEGAADGVSDGIRRTRTPGDSYGVV